MLKLSWMAAARLLLIIFPAVFFAPNCPAADSSLFGLENNLTNLVFRLSRSVVTVEASRRLPTSRFGSAADETYTRELTTGIVIDSGGLILVAARQVLGQDRITIRSESEVVAAELIAVDFQTELALVRANPSGCVPVRLAGNQACAGQMVITLGQAFGMRSAPSLGFCAGIRDDGATQFSVPSLGTRLGTGVFDMSGRLLGIVSGTIGRDPVMAVAVPAHKITDIVGYLLARGDRQCGWAGITTQEIEISPGLAVPYPPVMPASSRNRMDVIERGVVVTSVIPTSPADRAGLALGDLIFAVNQMPVNSAAGLASMVKQSLPGNRLLLEVIRRDQYLTFTLTVGRKSLNLSPESNAPRGDYDQARLVDSLRQALEQVRNQLQQLENRIDGLD